MALQPIDVANGVFSLIFISISILIGLKIISYTLNINVGLIY